MPYLILVRHGQSEWNEKGLWTGFADPSLNDVGRGEALKTAKALKDLKIDTAFTLLLKRAQETLEIILKNNGLDIPIYKDIALNERDYGKYTGQNKWEIKKAIGETEFNNLRRGWDYPIPEGESLKMVFERVAPYYQKEILPKLQTGQNVLVSASGNSLRALVKLLENIADDKVSAVSIGTGEAWVYETDNEGKILSKEIRAKNNKEV